MNRSRRELRGGIIEVIVILQKTSSERMGVLEARAEGAAGVGAGGEGLLRMSC